MNFLEASHLETADGSLVFETVDTDVDMLHCNPFPIISGESRSRLDIFFGLTLGNMKQKIWTFDPFEWSYLGVKAM